MTFIPNLQIFANPQISGNTTLSPSFRKFGGLNFGAIEPYKDSFATNPMNVNLSNEAQIKALAQSSPEIMSLLSKNNLPLKPNLHDLEKLKRGHLMNTRITIAKMYSALPPDLKSQVNMQDLQQAAMLHDIGKVLIPKEILNKPGALNQEEKEIMNLHPELGASLLKQMGAKSEVVNLVKYHHQNSKGTGYPRADGDYSYSTAAQMLTAADKYSALTEARPYHNPYSKQEALEIIQKDVDSGILSEEVYNALKKSV